MVNTKFWYVIYTKPRAEKTVNARLVSEGIETFFPLTKTLRQWSDRKKWVEQPLFNSYLFVHIPLKEYEKVRRTEGVVNFIYYSGKPAKIRENEIEALKLFLDSTIHKSIEFLPKDKVIIENGILSGKSGIIEKIGKNKVILIIEEIGAIFKAEVDKKLLSKI